MYYQNSGDTETNGVEFEAEVNWWKFDFSATGTWLNARYKGASDRIGIGGWSAANSRVKLQPEWEWHLRGESHLFDNALTVFAENHYTSEMREERGMLGYANRTSLSVTNLGVRFMAPWGFTLTAGVNDVFDKRPDQRFSESYTSAGVKTTHIWGLQFPLPGRMYYSTLEYKF